MQLIVEPFIGRQLTQNIKAISKQLSVRAIEIMKPGDKVKAEGCLANQWRFSLAC